MTHYAKESEKPPAKDCLRLYSMRFCPFAQRARLILAAKGTEYECININLKDKPDWYFDINPNGTVPAIELPDGKSLHESMICCEYIAEAGSEGRSLYPKDPFERNKQRLLVEIFGKKVIPIYKLLKQKDDATFQELTKQMKAFDTKLAEQNSAFFGGEKPGMLDYLIWPWLEKIPIIMEVTGFELPKDQFPVLLDWCTAMCLDEAVNECAYPAEWYKQFLLSYYTGKAEGQLIGSDIKP